MRSTFLSFASFYGEKCSLFLITQGTLGSNLLTSSQILKLKDKLCNSACNIILTNIIYVFLILLINIWCPNIFVSWNIIDNEKGVRPETTTAVTIQHFLDILFGNLFCLQNLYEHLPGYFSSVIRIKITETASNAFGISQDVIVPKSINHIRLWRLSSSVIRNQRQIFVKR